MLVSLHSKRSSKDYPVLLTICTELLQKLATKPIRFYYMETIGIKSIIFRVKAFCLQLDHTAVRMYFEECLQLLSLYSAHQDALSIVRIHG